MSWLKPRAEEPTHKEFIVAWQTSKTPFHVSVALGRLGYPNMHPEVCHKWAARLRYVGVRLRRLPRSKLPRLAPNGID